MSRANKSIHPFPLQSFLEEKTSEALIFSTVKAFTCSRDADIQSFIRNKAIDMEKKKLSRTYLLGGFSPSMETLEVFAYFSIAIKSLELGKTIPKKTCQDIFCSSERKSDTVPAYLIGQLGKNDSVTGTNPLRLHDIIEHAESHIRRAFNYVGGRLIFLECRSDIPKLNALYRAQGYLKLQERSTYNVFYKVIR